MLKIKEGKKTYIILGAGGTGSWLVQFLSKIDVPVVLIDGDIVEEKNTKRQNFVNKEINSGKASVVARRYGFPYVEEFMTDTSVIDEIIEFSDPESIPVLVGCLDNNASRKIAHDVFLNDKYKDIIWLDAGNAKLHGQTYVAVKENGEIKYDSPINLDPAFQNYAGDERRPDQISCAEHSESAPQNVTANITSATLLFDLINVVQEGGLLLGNKFSFNSNIVNIDTAEIIEPITA